MSIIHTVTRTFVAGGETEYPSEAEPLYEHRGVTHEAGDGTPTNVWTSNMIRWRYTWNSPRPEIVERWRQRYEAKSTFSHTDPIGTTRTPCIIPIHGFSFKLVYLPSASTAAGTTYQLTVEVWAAAEP